MNQLQDYITKQWNFVLSDDELAEYLLSKSPYYVWQGSGGCDTRPRVLNSEALPVPFLVGLAYEKVEDMTLMEGGDLITFLKDLPPWTLIEIPHYYGCNHLEIEYFTKKGNGLWDNSDD